MKISVVSLLPGQEDEIIFRCHTLPDDMNRFVYGLRYCELKFVGHDEHGISMITASDIYYFESVDKKVFALLDNDEKVIISRQYVPLLKDKLGVNGNI